MSKFKKFDKKNDLEMEKMETGTNIDKSAFSGILTKSKISKKDEILNKSLEDKTIPGKEIDNKSNISNTGSIKIEKEKPFKKYNSEKISGYFSFNKNKLKAFDINSEQERFDKIKFKTIKITNNNIIKRVREFVPAKEYLSLLEEIDDEEEIDKETKNTLNNEESKINKDKNNNSENQNLKELENKNIVEESKALEELKEINKILEAQNDDDLIYVSKNSVNKKVFDIYNIDANVDFNDKSEKKGKENDLLKYNFDLINNSCIDKINGNRFKELMKEKREKKFKKEFNDNFRIYTTNIFFKYGEYSPDINNYHNCILLLKKSILYVLNPDTESITEKTIRFFNPDISLIDNIIDKNINKEKIKDNYILKNKYNLSSPLLCLNFNLLSCILLINKNNINEFQIMILGRNDRFSFVLNDKETFNKYVFLIQSLINSTQGSKENKIGLSIKNYIFYKEIYITPYDFEREAKTGDLLLFKTIDTCADCQRFFTCDSYDHVAIILIKNKKIYLFESTSIGKCDTLSWNSFKQLFFNLVYHKIAYRKLNYENSNYKKRKENLKTLEENIKLFTEEIKGKDYYLSIPRFLCCKKPDSYEYDKDWKQSRGFCCSALAAALYIKLGVVKLEKSVHSTRPGDFEQDRNRLVFEEGYSLGPEKIIEFSE